MVSCTYKDEGLNLNEFPQTWRLVQMTGNIANMPPATGEDMSWQESITLNENKTFVKTQKRNQSVTSASGTYAFVTLSGVNYLKLTYDSENDLIANCTTELDELLRVDVRERQLIGSWSACDGPGLFYKQVPYDSHFEFEKN